MCKTKIYRIAPLRMSMMIRIDLGQGPGLKGAGASQRWLVKFIPMTTDLGSAVLNRCPPAQARHLDHRGVGLIMLLLGGQQIGTRSPIGKLMVTMLAAIAEFKRGISLERQREGVAKAKADGKNKGRKPTARAKPLR
jgi:hypothetical protein